ncbi:PrpF domain-containing protein [Cryobacterium sp. Y62]|uniref:PrpF domain-containing protein n=1 Tax=Cryobacterium sp. Y62 TaxID=2048284 RepID=UPI000CE357F5|nr:PrpF domain-containing protein [Cryobacterium sp. Y62]
MSASIRVDIMRGGTSRGVFALAGDLPTEKSALDDVVRAIMGSPDSFQIDGLGGTHAVSSKFVTVSLSDRPGADLDFQVAQVGVGDNLVDWSGTCGNLTSAVAPFAVNRGLLSVASGPARQDVVLYNESTRDLIQVSVSCSEGRFDPIGDTAIDGVAGTGSLIPTTYLDPAGGTLGVVFPTGNPTDYIQFDGVEVPVTLADITHPYAFVSGEDLGVSIHSSFADLHGDVVLQSRIEHLRAALAVRLGASEAQRSSVPRMMLCFPPREASDDIEVRAFAGGRFHPTVPVTGAFAAAAAARLEGTLVASMAIVRNSQVAVIRHPSGIAEVDVDVRGGQTVVSVGLNRTARLIMSGDVFVD